MCLCILPHPRMPAHTGSVLTKRSKTLILGAACQGKRGGITEAIMHVKSQSAAVGGGAGAATGVEMDDEGLSTEGDGGGGSETKSCAGR